MSNLDGAPLGPISSQTRLSLAFVVPVAVRPFFRMPPQALWLGCFRDGSQRPAHAGERHQLLTPPLPFLRGRLNETGGPKFDETVLGALRRGLVQPAANAYDICGGVPTHRRAVPLVALLRVDQEGTPCSIRQPTARLPTRTPNLSLRPRRFLLTVALSDSHSNLRFRSGRISETTQLDSRTGSANVASYVPPSRCGCQIDIPQARSRDVVLQVFKFAR